MTRTLSILAPILVLCLAAQSAVAGYRCEGTAPDWSLTVDDAQAQFVFPAPTQLDVMLTTPAEGRAWPKALTLIGARDTAIVLLEQQACDARPIRAHVLTQRGETPILLTGCCTEARP